MANQTDHYDTLGVKATASPDEIKRAYRRLAKKYHPDRNPDDANAEEKFKAVQRAYDILSDSDNRAQYDRFGGAGVGRWATQPNGHRVYQWGDHSSVNFDDLQDLFSAFGAGGGRERAGVFDDLFGGFRGGRAQPPSPQRGEDEHHPVALSFEQALNGAVITVRLTSAQGGPTQTLEVKIPPGVEEGQKIRIAGRGRVGRNGGPPGDFYLVCSIKPHSYFTRRGSDVTVDVPVTVTEAALGAKIEVPSLDGTVTVTLPAGTASGSKLRLKNRGLPYRTGNGRGDQYVVVRIVPPKTLSDNQRRLFEELREQEQADPRADCAWNKP